MRRPRFGRPLTAAATIVLACAGVGLTSVAPAYAGTTINGGGSGFAALEIDQWRADTARSPFNLSVNYVAQGSSFGRQQFSQGTVDYGVSDIQYVSTDVKPSKPFVYVPVSAGGVAFMYNVADSSGNKVTSLRLTRRAVCKIFTGMITKWNDPEIVAQNPGFASFDRNIRAVVRADGAGESYVLSEFCLAVAPDVWSAFVDQQRASPNSPNLLPEFLAHQPVSNWPAANWGPANDVNPVSIPYADGTANYVADPTSGADSITYVAAGYAKVRQAPVASVENAAHRYTQPDEGNVTVALSYAQSRGNGTFQLAYNGPAPDAYFPSTYSYVLAPSSVSGSFGADKGAVLAEFLCYAISMGQVIAPQLRYARLSAPLVAIAEDSIVRIPGAPSKQGCFVQGAPPPPPLPHPPGSNNPGGEGNNPGGNNGGGGNGDATRNGSRTGSSRVTTTSRPAANDVVARSAAARQTEAERLAVARETAQDKLNAELAAASAGTTSSRSHATVWILVLGVLVAAALNVGIVLLKGMTS